MIGEVWLSSVDYNAEATRLCFWKTVYPSCFICQVCDSTGRIQNHQIHPIQGNVSDQTTLASASMARDNCANPWYDPTGSKFPPLALFTSRDGSWFIVHFCYFFCFELPPASLKEPNTLSKGSCGDLLNSFHSSRRSLIRSLSDQLPAINARPAFPAIAQVSVGISCQTVTRLIAVRYHLQVNFNMLRTCWNPFLVLTTSNNKASSVGAGI